MITVNKTPLGFIVTYHLDDGAVITFNFKNLHEEKDGLRSLLEVRVSTPVLPEDEELVPYLGNVNLLAPQSRRNLAKYIQNTSKLIKDYNWTGIVEKVFQSVIEAMKPEEPVRIEPVENVEPEYLFYPILPKGHPTLIYAPGGSGKSFLAMYLSLLIENGTSIDVNHDVEPTETLYLDWEVDLNEARRRFTMLAGNLDFGNIKFPLYKRCVFPLKKELESILSAIAKYDVGFVVIDSAGHAVGGNINEASKVIEFANCVRQITSLGVTVLIISHVSKEERKHNDEEWTPIGSSYFENFARLNWELRYERHKDHIDFGLFPGKRNFGDVPPVGLRVSFEDGYAFFSKIDPHSVITSTEKTQAETVLAILMRSNGMDVTTLSKASGITKESLWPLLTKLKKKKLVINEEGIWRYNFNAEEG